MTYKYSRLVLATLSSMNIDGKAVYNAAFAVLTSMEQKAASSKLASVSNRNGSASLTTEQRLRYVGSSNEQTLFIQWSELTRELENKFPTLTLPVEIPAVIAPWVEKFIPKKATEGK
jgi:hypothetical protein